VGPGVGQDDMETFGGLLRQLRRARGWSQARLADALADTAGRATLSRHEVSGWERGRRLPRWWLPHIAAVFELDVTALERAARGVPAEVEIERLDYVAERPGNVDQATVDALAGTLAQLRRLDDCIGSEAVLPTANATLALVEEIARESRGKIRPAVLDVGAQWLQFGGWLNTTTKRHNIARVQHDRMVEWALELGDPDQLSTALNVKGHRAWTLNEYVPMVGLSEAARRDRNCSPAVLAVAAQQQARGHALLDEPDAAERLLDEADAQSARASEQPDRLPPWLYFHSSDLVILQRGLAYKLLSARRPAYRRKAIDAITVGLDGLDAETRASDWISWYDRQLDELRDNGRPGYD
jgi:transcriptional regulator with XRE-family HTH domain